MCSRSINHPCVADDIPVYTVDSSFCFYVMTFCSMTLWPRSLVILHYMHHYAIKIVNTICIVWNYMKNVTEFLTIFCYCSLHNVLLFRSLSPTLWCDSQRLYQKISGELISYAINQLLCVTTYSVWWLAGSFKIHVVV